MTRPITTIFGGASGRGSRRSRGGRGCPLYKPGNGIRKLRALMTPVIDAVQCHAQRLLALTGHRVVKADALDKAAVAPVPRVRDNDIEERALFGAASGQPYDHHERFPEEPKKILIIRRKNQASQEAGFAEAG